MMRGQPPEQRLTVRAGSRAQRGTWADPDCLAWHLFRSGHDDFSPFGSGAPRRGWGSGCVPVGFERRDQVTKNLTSATAATARTIYERVAVNSTDDPSCSRGTPLG